MSLHAWWTMTYLLLCAEFRGGIKFNSCRMVNVGESSTATAAVGDDLVDLFAHCELVDLITSLSIICWNWCTGLFDPIVHYLCERNVQFKKRLQLQLFVSCTIISTYAVVWYLGTAMLEGTKVPHIWIAGQQWRSDIYVAVRYLSNLRSICVLSEIYMWYLWFVYICDMYELGKK
jgi:hypothetical protein